MANRDTLLSAQFPSSVTTEPFVELDLREVYALPRLGRRGQLQFTTKLVFKARETYRQGQSMIQLWADVRISGQNAAPLPEFGRATLRDPVFFAPPPQDGHLRPGFDPWTRAIDRLVLDLDYRQVDEIEQRRQGGPLTFTFDVGGVVHHGGEIATLYPSNHQLCYEIGADKWAQLLAQLGYGTYLNIEVPVVTPGGLTGDVQKAAQALQAALEAFRRGDKEEAVADCRPGFDALGAVDKGKFGLKPWDQNASKDERFSWLNRSALTVTNLAHHPNDPAAAASVATATGARWEPADAEAVIAVLATLIRHRTRYS